MNTRDLKYLVALDDHRHFGKAAAACFVSQPALSMQIKKLEEMLGVPLLERTNKSVLFTDIGLAITERARQILQQVDEMREFAKLASDPLHAELKIGVIPTLAPYLLPQIMPALAKAFPKVSFYLVEKQTNTLLKRLKKAELDVVLLALPLSDPEIISKQLFTEVFYLAVAKHHRLAKLKKVAVKDLVNENILLLEEGHCLRDQALAFCHTSQLQEAPNFRATSLETLRQMVAAGLGVTLMPALARQKQDGIIYLPLSPSMPTRTIGMCWRATSTKSQLLSLIAQKITGLL